MDVHPVPAAQAAAPGPMPLEIRLDSEASWSALTSENFLKLDCRATTHQPFFFSALMARFSSSVVAELCLSQSRVMRRQSDGENSEQGYFKVLRQLAGRGRIRQGGRESELSPGQWTIYDTTREYVYESSERARFMVLLLPQEERMGWTSATAHLAGSALPGGGAAHIVFSGLAGLLRDGTPLDDESQKLLQDSSIALLERTLQGHLKDSRWLLHGSQEQKLQKIREHVLENLHDPRLTPDSLAAAFGMSRRSLYNLFLLASETPRAFIQQARLQRSARMLADPASRELSVAQLARACGFTDPSHFSRAFHAQFGKAPSVWRDTSPR